jgi:RNA polymerase sigma-70 factor (ECF subfamily)
MERYQGKVFSIAYALVRRRQDVEDIAQQVFTKVYFSIAQFDFRSAFLTWIYKITVNECYDYLRKQRSNRTICVSEMTEDEQRKFSNHQSEDVLPDRQAELAQTTALLLRKVPEEERLLLLLREVEGYSIHDLSRMFAWNENTVKVKLFRARQRLVKIAKRCV